MTEDEAARILLGPIVEPWSWESTLRPGTCGMAMLDKATRGLWFPSDAELYNIATDANLDYVDVGALAAKLYVAEARLLWTQGRLHTLSAKGVK